jgi:Ger(x)C family germination protein
MKIAKFLVSVLLLAALLPLSACSDFGSGWDSGDMKEVELVTALAVDVQNVQDVQGMLDVQDVQNVQDEQDEQEDGGVTAVVQLLNRDKALERQYSDSYYVLAAGGESLGAALGGVYRQGARQLNFSHTSLLLLGENAADCAVWLDYVQRSSQLRPTIYPVVCNGAAADLLQGGEEISPAYLLNNILEPLGSNYQGAAAVSLQNFLTAYYQPGIAPALPWVQHAGDGVQLVGFAVYDEGRAAAKISGDAALGWLLLTRAPYLQGYTLALADGAVLQISRAKVSCAVANSADLEDLRLNYQVDLRVKVLADPQNRTADELAEPTNERLQEILAVTLAEASSLKLDFPGFGREIYRKRPELWQELTEEYGNDYLERLTPTLEVTLKV